MKDAIQGYPLKWPSGWTRHQGPRRDARTRMSEEKSKKELMRSLKLFGAQHVVVSTNVELRRDGLPYSGRRAPDDPGVAVYWAKDGVEQCIACDVFKTVGENIRDIGRVIEALRLIERCGSSQIQRKAFDAFALPPANNARVAWRDVMNFRQDSAVTARMVETRYRELARARHPDNGGSHELMLELNAALAEARADEKVIQ